MKKAAQIQIFIAISNIFIEDKRDTFQKISVLGRTVSVVNFFCDE